jgi:hypothetical protein
MEPQNFLCHTWLSDERIIAGTDTGRLLLFESGELKNEFSVLGTAVSAPGTARYVLYWTLLNVVQNLIIINLDIKYLHLITFKISWEL